MKVMVLIPTYNRARFLPSAVESALAQTYGDREIVVVDDGSTDATAAVLEPYRDRITVISQERSGRSVARNRAIQSDAELVAYLDSDDIWLPDKLERQVDAFTANPSIGLLHGHVEVIDEEGHVLARETEEHQRLWFAANKAEPTYTSYALHCRCLTSTVMLRRNVLAGAGGYDPAFDHLEDLDLYLRILVTSRIAFLGGAPLTRYRSHTGQSDNSALARAQIAVSRKHERLLSEGQSVPHARRARRNLAINRARSHHILLEPHGVRRATLDALAADPSALLLPGVLRRLALSFAPVSQLRRRR